MSIIKKAQATAVFGMKVKRSESIDKIINNVHNQTFQ